MKLPVSWVRDFVDAPADPGLVAARLGACGFEVAAIEGDVIDLEITANRPDCMSVCGLAREMATAFDLEIKESASSLINASGAPPPLARAPALEDSLSSRGPRAPHPAQSISVTIESEACGRYALVVVDVTVGPSPAWLADRLAAAGVRPINNIVDVTNYVMLEMGHPMHAFDAARLAGSEIRVRLARAGEKLTTLDGQTRVLDPTMLVIADRDRAVAVAGVMGGATSEVSATTSRIALESAWFQPASVRATGRRLSLKTEASARFERGADIGAPVRAIGRALSLFEQIGAGRAAEPIVDVYPRPPAIRTTPLGRDHLARLLGDAVPDAEVERILTKLGFGVTPGAGGWRVQIPTFRVDVQREADLIEEVGRHWGFDRIPATFPALRSVPRPAAPSILRGRTVRRVLTGAGLQEAVTFTFMELAAALPFVAEAAELVVIANPLSEKFAVLRPSLLPGLLDALIYSRRRETSDVRIFEAGSVVGPRGERQAVGWVMAGARSEHWSAAHGAVDFFDAKGTAELLATAFETAIEAEAAEVPWCERGQAARLVRMAATGPIPVGVVGRIRPEIASARGLGHGEAVFAGEMDLAALVAAGARAERRVTSLPRYPSIIRDLSIVVDERLPAAAVRGTIRASASAMLVATREFDRYQGEGVPNGRVSLSIRLTFRATDRTLTDADVQQEIDAVVAALARQHGATLRGSGN